MLGPEGVSKWNDSSSPPVLLLALTRRAGTARIPARRRSAKATAASIFPAREEHAAAHDMRLPHIHVPAGSSPSSSSPTKPTSGRALVAAERFPSRAGGDAPLCEKKIDGASEADASDADQSSTDESRRGWSMSIGLVHGVTRLTRGARYSLIAWFQKEPTACAAGHLVLAEWLYACGVPVNTPNDSHQVPLIHRDIKPANIFIDVSYNADVAPDLDGEPDLEKRLGALIKAGKENGYVTYTDIAYAQGEGEEFDTALDFYSDLIMQDIEVREGLTDTILVADFGASKNWSLEGKNQATMVHLRTEPWTPPRTDAELFFQHTIEATVIVPDR